MNLNKKKEKALRFTDILPLNAMWLDYMRNLLGVENFSELPTNPLDNKWEIVNQKIMKADYHGAKISVIRSKCPSLVGIHGIVLQDTRNTFRIIGEDDQIRSKLYFSILYFLNNIDLINVLNKLKGTSLHTHIPKKILSPK